MSHNIMRLAQPKNHNKQAEKGEEFRIKNLDFFLLMKKNGRLPSCFFFTSAHREQLS